MKIKSTEHVRTKSLILTFYFDLFLLLLLLPDASTSASSFMNVRSQFCEDSNTVIVTGRGRMV